MKKLFIASLSLVFITSAIADIQAPPGQLGPSDKLGRAVSTLLWGWTEFGATIARDSDVSYSKAFGSGGVRGFNRALARYGWGFYELTTYALPTYKGSYRAPYTYRNTIMNPTKGFLEFPPEMDRQTAGDYARIQRY